MPQDLITPDAPATALPAALADSIAHLTDYKHISTRYEGRHVWFELSEQKYLLEQESEESETLHLETLVQTALPAEHLHAVRLACMLANDTNTACNASYSFNVYNNKMSVRIEAQLPILSDFNETQAFFQTTLTDMRRINNRMAHELDKEKRQGIPLNGRFSMLESNQDVTRILMAEREYAAAGGLRVNGHQPLTLPQLLAADAATANVLVTSLRIASDGVTTDISDDAVSYDLIPILKNLEKDSGPLCIASSFVRFNDEVSVERHFTLLCSRLASVGNVTYFRYSTAICPLSDEQLSDEHPENNLHRHHGVLVVDFEEGQTTQPAAKNAQMLRQTETDIDNMRNDIPIDKAVEARHHILYALTRPAISHHLQHATTLFLNARYDEAIHCLMPFFRQASRHYMRYEDLHRSDIMMASHILGLCFYHLGRYREARVFLEGICEHSTSPIVVNNFLNVLSAIHDPNLLRRIDDFSKQLADDRQLSADIREQQADYLLRRRIYALADAGRYDEASTLLRKIEKNDDMSDFVQTEQSYIARNTKPNR